MYWSRGDCRQHQHPGPGSRCRYAYLCHTTQQKHSPTTTLIRPISRHLHQPCCPVTPAYIPIPTPTSPSGSVNNAPIPVRTTPRLISKWKYRREHPTIPDSEPFRTARRHCRKLASGGSPVDRKSVGRRCRLLNGIIEWTFAVRCTGPLTPKFGGTRMERGVRYSGLCGALSLLRMVTSNGALPIV